MVVMEFILGASAFIQSGFSPSLSSPPGSVLPWLKGSLVGFKELEMKTEVLANTSNASGLTQTVRSASLRPSAMKTAVDAERYIAFCESCLSTIEEYLRGALQQSDNGPLVWRYRDGTGNECEVSVSDLTLKVTGSERFHNFLFYRAGSDSPAITAAVQDGPLATGPKDGDRPSVWTLVGVIGEQGRACNLHLDIQVATEYPLPKRDTHEGSLRALGVVAK